MRRTLALTFAVLIAGCASILHQPTRVELGESFRLGYEETVVIEGASLQLHFQDVVEDSRCASDVQCVWAGTVRLVLLAEGRDVVTDTLDLTRAPRDTVGEYEIHFTGYSPPPGPAGSPPAVSEGEATIVVSRVPR